MLKLLVADDERILREAVCYLIDWKSIGIELAASCKNGREAYEVYDQDHYDEPDMILERVRKRVEEQPNDEFIILTDIKMPGLSGLDLVEKLSEPGRVLEFILLTGYADFEYAHRALSHRVHHYLLKPCNEQQIIEAVQQAAQSIYTRRQLQQMEPTCAGVARPEYSETVQKVVDYLEKHYSDAALSLKGLAANYLFMNPDYVSRQFLQQTGYRFVDYLLALRIRKAQWLLVNGVPPQQVPERVGYSANPQYFVHLFSKATGMTPREYAQALRIEP